MAHLCLWYTSIGFSINIWQFLSNSSRGLIIFWLGPEHAASISEANNMLFQLYVNVFK